MTVPRIRYVHRPARTLWPALTIVRYGAAATIIAAAASQAAFRPLLVLAAIAAALFVLLASVNLLSGLVVFTIVTFPEQLPGANIATVAKPAGAVLIFAWLLALIQQSQVPFLPHERPLLTAAVGGFVIWASASAVWAEEPSVVFSNATRLTQAALLFLIVYSAVRTGIDLRIVVWGYLTAAFATSLYALVSGVSTEGRLTGGIQNPNFLAAELVVAMLLAGFLFAATPSLAGRMALFACLAAYAPAFVLTQSRGGLVALAIGLLMAITVAGPLRPRVLATVLIVVGLGIGYYALAAPQMLVARVTSHATAGRADEWRIALRIFVHHPIAGAGLGNFPVLEPSFVTEDINLVKVRYDLQGLVAHNTYLEILSELGIIGLSLFVAILVGVAGAALRGVRGLMDAGDAATATIGRGVIAATTALLAAYAFGSGQYEKPLWLMLGLLAVVARLRPQVGASDLDREFGT